MIDFDRYDADDYGGPEPEKATGGASESWWLEIAIIWFVAVTLFVASIWRG